jgi:hypothetical protein
VLPDVDGVLTEVNDQSRLGERVVVLDSEMIPNSLIYPA